MLSRLIKEYLKITLILRIYYCSVIFALTYILQKIKTLDYTCSILTCENAYYIKFHLVWVVKSITMISIRIGTITTSQTVT